MAIPEQRLIFKHIDAPGYTRDIECYLKHGGYEMLKKGLAMGPSAIRDEVKRASYVEEGARVFRQAPSGVLLIRQKQQNQFI